MAATLEQLVAEVEVLKQRVEEGRRARDELEIQKVQSLYSHYYQVGMRSEIAALFAQHTPGDLAAKLLSVSTQQIQKILAELKRGPLLTCP